MEAREVEKHPSLHSWLVRQDLNPGLSTLGACAPSTIPGLREAHCSLQPTFPDSQPLTDSARLLAFPSHLLWLVLPLPSHQIWGGVPQPSTANPKTSPCPRSPPVWFPYTHSFLPLSSASSVPLLPAATGPTPDSNPYSTSPLATPQVQAHKRSHFLC